MIKIICSPLFDNMEYSVGYSSSRSAHFSVRNASTHWAHKMIRQIIDSETASAIVRRMRLAQYIFAGRYIMHTYASYNVYVYRSRLCQPLGG